MCPTNHIQSRGRSETNIVWLECKDIRERRKRRMFGLVSGVGAHTLECAISERMLRYGLFAKCWLHPVTLNLACLACRCSHVLRITKKALCLSVLTK